MKPLKLAVATTSRADYGIIKNLVQNFEQDDFFQTRLVALGMHASKKYGESHNEIKKDGLEYELLPDSLIHGNDECGISQNLAETIKVFSHYLQKDRPDAIMVLGDRYEMFAVASSAIAFNIPLIHLYGGIITPGAIDNKFRWAISQFSSLHFVDCEMYQQCLIDRGFRPELVHNVGSLAVEYMQKKELLPQSDIEQQLGFALEDKFLLATYHPVTTALGEIESSAEEFYQFLIQNPVGQVIVTQTNADTQSDHIRRAIERAASSRPDQVKVFENLGHLMYHSLMQKCSAVVGNSSSGILEAASYQRPVVNIGPRQTGRAQSANVINCRVGHQEIIQAVEQALKMPTAGIQNIYDGGDSTQKILTAIKQTPLEFEQKI